MDHLQKFTSQVRGRIAAILLVNNLFLVIDWWLAEQIFHLVGYWLIAVLLIVPILSLTVLPWLSTKLLIQPTKLIWQAILHLAPGVNTVPAPDLMHIRFGRELVVALVNQVYQLASAADSVDKLGNQTAANLDRDFVANSLPLPMLIMGNDNSVVFANKAMLEYIGKSAGEIKGQSLYGVLNMSFLNDQTLDRWLAAARASKAVDTHSWERVKLTLADDTHTSRQFDLAAYYNKNNLEHFETMLVMFDHTAQYSQDDQAMSFVALAVHELRTPLTLLRGYIEAFEEELDGQLSPEMEDFMHKMTVASQQLSAFVNNILDVARIEGDHLDLKLHEAQWPAIMAAAVEVMRLPAEVRGITLRLDVADDLPAAGVDALAAQQVLINLIDNAIKYSASSKQIDITSRLNGEGMIETTVQDYGVGIPESALPHIFDKFYRNYRNRAQVGGTGLGLYLCKALIEAFGGTIRVSTKPDRGSCFTFTVQPYAALAAELKNGNNMDIIRSAHGWIKNHSMYRR